MPRRKLQKGNYEDKYGRQYQNCEVNRKDVFQIERYYRWNKFIPQFKRTILRLKNMCKSDYKPFLCVFHSLRTDTANVENIDIHAHGNSKKTDGSCRQYIRTKPSVLKRQYALLSSSKPPQELYRCKGESGGSLKIKTSIQATEESKASLQSSGQHSTTETEGVLSH